MHIAGLIIAFSSLIAAKCFAPGPAYPPPVINREDPIVQKALQRLELRLSEIASDGLWNSHRNSSWALSLTSQSETLWDRFHSQVVHE